MLSDESAIASGFEGHLQVFKHGIGSLIWTN
jgi:hypothetical protein